MSELSSDSRFYGICPGTFIAIQADNMIKFRSGFTGVLLPVIPMPDDSNRVDPQSVRMTAMNILAAREHSRLELQNKLMRKFCLKQDDESVGYEQLERVIDDVLEQLVQDRLLDDRRFAESFVRSRISRGNGPVKIRHELLERGVATELIDDYLDESFDFWQETIEAVRSKRFGVHYPEDYKEQTRQSRFLYQRGFSAELIRRLFRG